MYFIKIIIFIKIIYILIYFLYLFIIINYIFTLYYFIIFIYLYIKNGYFKVDIEDDYVNDVRFMDSYYIIIIVI